MHTRKRPDWPQLVYSYRAYPHELPQSLWDQARAMQALWNRLVELRDQVREHTQSLTKEEAKPLWTQLNSDLRHAAKESGLGWEAADAVLDRFQTASRKAAKEGAALRTQYRLDKIMIPHRFTGGGVSVERFFAQRTGKRARIAPVDPSVYELTYWRRREADRTAGVFGLDRGAIPFTCHLHRPIPPGSFIKQAWWIGTFNRHRPARWEWHIQLVVERPPYPAALPGKPIAGLDLGWRIMAEGEYLRMGFLTDSEGRSYELRLPMLRTDTRDSRKARKHEVPRLHTVYALWRLDEEIGNGVEDCKAQLRERLTTLPPGFVQMRQGGLRKLAQAWAVTGEHAEEQAIIGACLLKDAELWRLKTGLQDRLVRRKQWLYRNIADWLTRTYGAICWEGNLSTKQIAQQEEGPALQNAAKFRQWAAVGEFRLYLKQAAVKNGDALIGPDGAFSTMTCWECGDVLAERSGALYLECRNGHRWDQDANASKNFLWYGISQTSPGLLQDGELRKYLAEQQPEPLDIPEVLRAVVVPSS